MTRPTPNHNNSSQFNNRVQNNQRRGFIPDYALGNNPATNINSSPFTTNSIYNADSLPENFPSLGGNTGMGGARLSASRQGGRQPQAQSIF